MGMLSSFMIHSLASCTDTGHSFFVNCFYQIFAAMCPLAVIALYLSMTSGSAIKERLTTAKTACLVAWGIMIFTALGGPKALETIGIAMEAFHISGGLLLIVIGFDLLRSEDPEVGVSQDEVEKINHLPKKKRQDVAITPLGIPLMAGPGTLTIVLSNSVARKGIVDLIFCLLAISLVIFLMYWILVITSKGAKWLTPTVLKLGFRLSGLFLVTIGVQLVMNGLKETDLLANLASQYVIS